MSKPKNIGLEPQAFLQALRPAPGEVVDFAVLTTYSADLVVITAALLALGGFDGDDGSESKVNLVDAYDRLKDRLVVLHQSGRLAVPAKRLAILKLLDSVMRAVNTEEGFSFHPKIALVRYHVGEVREEFTWRLWLGSRNLTRAVSWELGFSAESSSNAGQELPGVEDLAADLAALAAIKGFSAAEVRKQIRQVKWKVPKGVQVTELKFWKLGETRLLPDPPKELSRVSVISPFVDGTILSEIGKWGNEKTKRIVVSTLPELSRLAQQKTDPLKGFSDGLRYLDSPEDDLVIPEQSEAADSELDFSSLHAKALLVDHSKGSELWFGSCNATVRGFRGPNSEVFVRVKITPEIAAGIESFLNNRTTEIEKSELVVSKAAERSTDFQLACDRLASTWNLRQRRESEKLIVSGDVNPHIVVQNASIQIAHLGQPSAPWGEDASAVSLEVKPGQETEFVEVFIQRGDEERRWLQLAPIENFKRGDRDRAVLFSYLDSKAFLAWLKALLEGSTVEHGGGKWDEPVLPVGKSPKDGEGFQLWSPSLEQILRAYVRDPLQLGRVDALLADYIDYIEKDRPDLADDPSLHDLRKVWPIIKTQLIGKSAKAGVV